MQRTNNGVLINAALFLATISPFGIELFFCSLKEELHIVVSLSWLGTFYSVALNYVCAFFSISLRFFFFLLLFSCFGCTIVCYVPGCRYIVLHLPHWFLMIVFFSLSLTCSLHCASFFLLLLFKHTKMFVCNRKHSMISRLFRFDTKLSHREFDRA